MTRRTKIVCSLGPACDSESTLKRLIGAGMDVARINMAFGMLTEQTSRAERLRRTRREMGSPCALMIELKGPEIRTGGLMDGAPVRLMAGSHFTLTERDVEGTSRIVTQTFAGLGACVEPGTIITLDAGRIELAVDEVDGSDILCTVQNSGILAERVTLNVPGVAVPLPTITDEDRIALQLAVEQEADFVVVPFVRSAQAVAQVRSFLAQSGGSDIQVICKIENAQGLDNVEEIIEASDGVIIDRDTLSVELSNFAVPGVQIQLTEMCRRLCRPVIVTGQLLSSMEKSPTPSRTEVSDLANAVFAGIDACVLAGETAVGSYPVTALMMAVQVIESGEPLTQAAALAADNSQDNRIELAVGRSAVTAAEACGAKCIVAPTVSGHTARLISNLRPAVPVYSVSPTERAMRQQQLLWGVTPLMGEVQCEMKDVVKNAQATVVEAGYLASGDVAVFTAGDRSTSPQVEESVRGIAGGVAATNVMYVIQIHDDAQGGAR